MPTDSTRGRLNRRDLLKRAGTAGTVGLAGLAGCAGGGGDGGGGGGDTETTTAAPETTAQSGSETFKIGGLHPLVGAYAPLGKTQRNGVKAAIAKINEEGGINGKEVEGIFEDTKVEPQTGKQKARKLVEQDGVDMLTGCVSSAVGLAVLEYAAQVGKIYMIPGAANALTGKSCEEIGFRYEASADQIASATAPWAVDNFGTNIWIHNADYAWGNSVGSAWKRVSKAHDSSVNIVGETKSQLGATDFSSYISRISASDADWVVTGLNGGDAVNFLKQANSYGLKGEKTIVSPTNSFRFIRKAAGKAATNTYSAFRYYVNYDAPGNEPFVKRYRNMFDSFPDNFAQVSWTHVNTWAQAVKSAGSADSSAVADALLDVSFEGPMGSVSYRDCDHQAMRTIAMGKIVKDDPNTERKIPSLNVMNSVSGEDAIPPCSQTGCSL